MSAAQHNAFMHGLLRASMADRPKELPSDWCSEHLQFDEAGNHSPFSTHGHEYVIDVLNDFADPLITDEALVWGSQARKTGTMMGGVAWKIVNAPCSMLWVMPTMQLGRKFGRNRLGKLFKKSPCTAKLISDQDRHSFSTTEMALGASQLSIVGSNSASNLASAPCAVVILDEVEKFPEKVGDEADADSLAAQRTKDTPNPQRWRTSTPALSSGLIWQNYLKGDQRRYFVPCPGCFQLVLFAWSKNFTALSLTGSEAFVEWDKTAKGIDGSWNLEGVKATAHASCPFCKCRIEDGQKMKMIRGGKWRATNTKAPPNVVSRQLSSLYSPSPECSFGAMAVKFLQAKESMLGLQSFINGDLAEPYESQDKRGPRVELVSKPDAEGKPGEWSKLMTVDRQNTNPHFYWLIRRWKAGDSEGIACGSCDSVEELRIVQAKHEIQDVAFVMDSGFETMQTYRDCARFSNFKDSEGDGLPISVGWMPAKGLPGDKRWRDEETELLVPWCLRDIDPFIGTSEAGQLSMSLFEFAADFFKDILAALREGKGGHKWSVSQAMNNDEYWRHMDGELKDFVFNKMTGRTTRVWKRRSSRWPNHWLDCENMQVAAANFFRLFSAPELEEKQTK